MRVKLTSGKELSVFITHIKPSMTPEDIENASPFTQEAARYLGEKQNGTVAVITEAEIQLGIGTAKLVVTDTFHKHVGLQLALSRALSKTQLEKRDRAVIWDQVFSGKYTKKK